MSSDRVLIVPDIADRHRHYLALAMLFVALAYAAEAGQALLAGGAAQIAQVVSIVAAVGVFLFIGPILLWKVRKKSARLRDLYRDGDGFVADALSRAHVASWTVTFIFMAAVSRLDETLSGMTGFTLIYISVAMMAVTFGASFLWLSREGADATAREEPSA